MPYTTAELLKSNGVIGPQYYDPVSDGFKPFVQGSGSLNSGIVNVTTPGTRVQLPNVSCRKITIIAKRTNGGLIYVGGGTVSATSYGDTLAAKESITIEVANAYLVWIDADAAGEGISYIAI